MFISEHLVEQNIRGYESRLNHVDELLERANKGAAKTSEPSAIERQLAELRNEREKLADHIEYLKKKSLEEWQEEGIEKSGPMIIWDAVARKLEKLVERISPSNNSPRSG